MRNSKIVSLLLLLSVTFIEFSWSQPPEPPDFLLKSSAITFSKEFPQPDEVIFISATIKNIGGEEYEFSISTAIDPTPAVKYDPLYAGDEGNVTVSNGEPDVTWLAQYFVPEENILIGKISLLLKDFADTSSKFRIVVRNDSFELKPSTETADILVSTSVDCSNITLWHDFCFSTPTFLVANTTYWICAELDSFNTHYWRMSKGVSNGQVCASNDKGASWIGIYPYIGFFRVYKYEDPSVKFYKGDPDSGGTFIGSDTIMPLQSEESVVASSTWTVTPGAHNIYVHVNRDDYVTESGTGINKSSSTFLLFNIISAETVDDNLDGKIDGYHITFSTNIDDSTLTQTDIEGFTVGGYTGVSFSSAGLTNHLDTPNDFDIFISFTEGVEDTDSTPDLKYNGNLKSLAPGTAKLLQVVVSTTVTESDGAAPVIHSALASDASGNGPGIQAKDEVIIEFSESVNNPPNITDKNIDKIFKGTFTWTWLDGNGFILTKWSAVDSILTITLSDGGGPPAVSPGYEILTDTFTFTDSEGNVSSYTFVLGGDFGVDITSPTIVSRETRDLNSDGYIDAIYIIFNENIDDSTVIAGSFDVAGVTGEPFSSTTAGDTANNSAIYITFTDGVLKTDETPVLNCAEGAVKDLSGKHIPASNAPCADKSPPAILSAVASDEDILMPGVDSDDTVIIKFSEKTNMPTINSSNINNILRLNNSHTWGEDAKGEWNTAGDTLTITFGSQVSSATVSTGDYIVVSTTTLPIEDSEKNICAAGITISGTFKGTDINPPAIVSFSPEQGCTGVPVSTYIAVVFSERMNAGKAESAISVTGIENNSRENINESVTATVVYDTETRCLTFSPTADLKNNYTYKVTVSTDASDTIGNHLASQFEFKFITIMDYNESNTTTSDDGKISITLASGSLGKGFYIRIITSTAQDSQGALKISEANGKLALDDDPFSFALNYLWEIMAFDSSGNPITDLNSPASITLYYDDSSNNGTVDGTNPPLMEESLKMHWLDETNNLWVKLTDSTVDYNANKITGRTSHFTVFSLHGSGTTNLSDAFAFPVPFIPSRGDTTITFTDISSLCTIKVYTLNGELVKQFNHSGGEQEFWTNVDLASGVYLYVIKNEKSRKKGKIVVIR